jgi:predicted HTH domain antitoxin
MRVNVPDDIARRAEAGAAELRVALAIQLYADNRIDHADACRLARLRPSAFNRELLARGIGVQQYPAGPFRSAERAPPVR